jgi:hypothetical protein
LIALLPKRLQKYSSYFYRARLRAKFLKFIFKPSRSKYTPLISGAQRYQLHFHSGKLFKRFFQKDLSNEKRFREAEKSAIPWAFPKDYKTLKLVSW